ncbi:MAG: hypothetical protein ABIJ30_10845 [bacterium]
MKVLRVLVALSLLPFLIVFQSQADEPAKAPDTIYKSWDIAGPTHKWITEDAVNLLINKEGVRYIELRAFIKELKEGATREDDLFPQDRTKNHYYNPETKKGIHASSIGWALGTEKDGNKENEFTLSKALEESAILGEQLTVQQSNIAYNDCLYCLKDIPIDKAIDRQHAKTLGNM